MRWTTWFRLTRWGWSDPTALPPRNALIVPHHAEMFATRNVRPWWV